MALEHMRLHHPGAPIDEERVREIISARSYGIEYVVVCTGVTCRRRRSSVSSLIEALIEAAGRYSPK